jgi:hypothetical protein
MSFQDVVGKPKVSSISGATTLTATTMNGVGGGYMTSAGAVAAAAPTSAPLPMALWTSTLSSSTTVMSQISDSLTQYQVSYKKKNWEEEKKQKKQEQKQN